MGKFVFSALDALTFTTSNNGWATQGHDLYRSISFTKDGYIITHGIKFKTGIGADNNPFGLSVDDNNGVVNISVGGSTIPAQIQLATYKATTSAPNLYLLGVTTESNNQSKLGATLYNPSVYVDAGDGSIHANNYFISSGTNYKDIRTIINEAISAVDAMRYRGIIGSSALLDPTSNLSSTYIKNPKIGDTYKISNLATYKFYLSISGEMAEVSLEAGDTLIVYATREVNNVTYPVFNALQTNIVGALTIGNITTDPEQGYTPVQLVNNKLYVPATSVNGHSNVNFVAGKHTTVDDKGDSSIAINATWRTISGKGVSGDAKSRIGTSLVGDGDIVLTFGDEFRLDANGNVKIIWEEIDDKGGVTYV